MIAGGDITKLIQHRIDAFIAERAAEMREISSRLEPFVEVAESFLQGGKRFRAAFCITAWQGVNDLNSKVDFSSVTPSANESPQYAILGAAAALEIFHAAALVHDDLIDNSDTRRGAPSAHRQFEAQHKVDVRHDGEFGRAGAILLGDLLLGWSDELFDEALAPHYAQASARTARLEFMTMRNEVTAGQYLDVLEGHTWRTQTDSNQRERASEVLLYKSAKYSVEAPLRIGAAIAGASPSQQKSLQDFGRPLGVAYQLRDDLLGVFGDPVITGKPAGDDLREGKRTMLIAIAHERLGLSQRSLVNEMLGDPDISPEQIIELQSMLRNCGAVDEIEAMISQNLDEARLQLSRASLAEQPKERLDQLSVMVGRRSS